MKDPWQEWERRQRLVVLFMAHSVCFALALLWAESMADKMSLSIFITTTFFYGAGVALSRMWKAAREESSK